MSVFGALKLGLTVAREIRALTSGDPLAGINSQLSSLVAQSAEILDGVNTVQATLVLSELADRESDIRQALYNLREAQTNPDALLAQAAGVEALRLSLDAITDLTILATNSTPDQIERTAVIPLLVSALVTRTLIIEELRDSAWSTHDGDALLGAAVAIEASSSALIDEIANELEVYVESGYFYFSANFEYRLSVNVHFKSITNPSVTGPTITLDMNYADGNSIVGTQGPGPRDTARVLQWAEDNGINLAPSYALPLQTDLADARHAEMLSLTDDIRYLTSGTWHLGGGGNDTLISDQSPSYGVPDTLDGRGGNDMITGGHGPDLLRGQAGNDTLIGGQGDDRLDGGSGTDWVYMLGPVSAVAFLDVSGPQYTTRGMDTFVSIENIMSGDGIDYLSGDSGANHFSSGAGSDTLYGQDGSDTLNGGDGDDFIYGGATSVDLRDVVYGGAGNDRIDGGYGNDELRGDVGNDTIEGWFGADIVIGGNGHDILNGGAWGDALFGGLHNDFLNGGFGFDRLNGGYGADRFFHLGVSDHGSDWIQDYSAAEGDVLQFGQAGNISQFQVNFTETASAGTAGIAEAFVIYRPTGQILWALVDGQAQSEINLLMGGVTYDLLA